MRGSAGPQSLDAGRDAANLSALLCDMPFLFQRPSMQIDQQCLQRLDVIRKAAQHARQVCTGGGRRSVGGMSHYGFSLSRFR